MFKAIQSIRHLIGLMRTVKSDSDIYSGARNIIHSPAMPWQVIENMGLTVFYQHGKKHLN